MFKIEVLNKVFEHKSLHTCRNNAVNHVRKTLAEKHYGPDKDLLDLIKSKPHMSPKLYNDALEWAAEQLTPQPTFQDLPDGKYVINTHNGLRNLTSKDGCYFSDGWMGSPKDYNHLILDCIKIGEVE